MIANLFGFFLISAVVLNACTPTTGTVVALKLVGNGHRVVDAPAADSGILVRLGLKKYWSDISIHFWDIEVSGILAADVSILRRPNEEPLLSKMLQGAFRESRQFATDGAYESVLNGALREFIRSFARDPSVLKALEQGEAARSAQTPATEGATLAPTEVLDAMSAF